MSNLSESSSSSCPRGRGRVSGVPSRCWCGTSVCQLISKSALNPYRRYYHCSYVVDEKLRDDEHVFKWIDEAHLNEIETLQQINKSLKKEAKEAVAERNAREDIVFDKVQMRLEKEFSENMEVVLGDSTCRVKMIMICVVIVCMVMIGISKFFGEPFVHMKLSLGNRPIFRYTLN